MKDWQGVLEDVAALLTVADVQWMLVGSAATAVHGAAIRPGDIDILMGTPGDLRRAADILPSRQDRWTDADPRDWHSSITQPVLTFTDNIQTHWTFGRWTIAETKVELAHLASAEPNHKLIETGDPVWGTKVSVHWRETLLPVVPIELQIGTMIARDQQGRLAATLAAVDLEQFDKRLLHQTIADRDIGITDPRIPGLLGSLLRD